ncbi:MAG: caspase family protein [Ginsengibacter sp.]
MSKRTIYASFIGIDAYPQSSLRGCIKDVLDMDMLLRDQLAQQPDIEYKPVYFLAPNDADLERISSYETQNKIKLDYKKPTFKIVTTEAFAHLKNAGNDNDICFFYYSGHGSQTEAPEIFWHSKPDRQNETIVCVDSRDPNAPGARDIIDKELAFLLWDALSKGEKDADTEKKGPHCLVIMDCCHSGNNTRAAARLTDIKFRYESPSDDKIPLDKYIGYHQGFYKITNGNAKIKIARYVHMAAARDSEKAQESFSGGLFTSKLIEVLRTGGTSKSYRELVQVLSITINNQASDQNPVAYARVEKDLDLKFLGNGIKAYQPSYEVRYDFAANKWILYGGAFHAIVPASGNAKTIVKINKGQVEVEIEVKEVGPFTSILDSVAMASLDKEIGYQAVIVRMANRLTKVGLSSKLLSQTLLLENIKNAYKKGSYLFFEIDFENAKENIDYLVQLTDDNNYVLTKQGSDMPLFKREINAVEFLKDVDAVCKWVSVSELENSKTKFSKDDFIFNLEKIEGSIVEAETIKEWDSYKGVLLQPIPGNEIIFSYKGENRPAFRFNISLSKTSTQGSCFIGALYMDNRFGIEHNLIDLDKGQLQNGGSQLDLSWKPDENEYKTIPLDFDPFYSDLNIPEISEFLKIFISSKPLNLERYKQDSLELDEGARSTNRSIGLGAPRTRGTAEQDDWTVFTFPFRIVGPNKEKKLEEGKPSEFSSFTIEVPKNFKATAFVATGNDLQQKLRFGTRSADALTQMVSPPENIWGDIESAETPFGKGLSVSADNGIQVLELFPEDPSKPLKINEGEEILIRPKKTRDIATHAGDETIIPFAYDEKTQLYFPVGFSDDNGVIHILQLPAPTAGLIRGEEKLTRSIGGSIKLFFKKIFQSKTLNTLSLYKLDPGEPWQKITDDPKKMKMVFDENINATVVLLIHGIFGDTKSITGSLMEVPGFSNAVQFVLAYDYENLASPIKKTAERLHEYLSDAGFGSGNGIKLSIAAHSMGGLVARCLVEQPGADAYVKQLIFAGTPNAGSEMAHLKSAAMGLLTHAMNVTGPVKYVITGLSFLLKKLELDPGKTLDEMNPGSDFLQKLALSNEPANISYSIIAGDTSLLKNGYKGDDFFLKKLADMLEKGVVYPGLTFALFNKKPNDIAVTLDSMRTIPGFDNTRMYVLASDHLTYFSEDVSRKKLIELIKGRT